MYTQNVNSPSLLHVSGESIVSTAALKELIGSQSVRTALWRNKAGKSKYWSEVEVGGVGYITIKSLPKTTADKLRSEFGDIEAIAMLGLLHPLATDAILPDDGDYFREHEARFTPEKISALVEATGWLRSTFDQAGRHHFTTNADYHAAVVGCLKVRDLYGFSVTSSSSLRRRLKKWKDSGIACMVPGYYGNANKKKHSEVEEQFVIDRLIDLYADPTKASFVTVATIVNSELEEEGIEPLSTERCRQLLTMPINKALWVHHRHGDREGRNITERIIKRRRPRLPDVMWSIDGTPVQLYARDEEKAYKLITPWYAFAVVDVATDCIIGFSVGRSENSALVVRALRNAVRCNGTIPKVIHYDGASANLAKESQNVMTGLRAVGVKAQAYNAKAKHVERVFGLLEGQFLRTAPNFKGGNITAKSNKVRANPDYLKAQIKAGTIPTADVVADQYAAYVDLYNNSKPSGKTKTRMEAYLEHSDRRRKITPQALSDAFWIERKKKPRYNPKGLEIQVEGARLSYEVESDRGIENMEFRSKHLGSRFEVRYDPEDASAVGLYQEGVWVALANLKYEYSADPTDHAPDDKRRLNESILQRRVWLEDGKSRRIDIRVRLDNQGYGVLDPQMAHKDAFNAASSHSQDVLNGISNGQATQVLAKAETTAAAAARASDNDAEAIDFGSPFEASDELLQRMKNGIKADND